MNGWRDPVFVVALAAGPAAALVLAALPGLVLAPGLHYPLPALALAILVYPPLEEWVFRGELQPALARRLPARLGPLSAANGLTSLAFAALHLLAHPPAWAAAVFLPSLVFGFMRERSGGLAQPITLHLTYNASYFLLLQPM